MSDNAEQYDTFIEFGDAPQLREVLLSGISTADVLLPWAQLESLELDTGAGGYDDVSELVEILRLCPRLRRFSVPLNNLFWDTPLDPTTLLRHTALEALEFINYSEKYHPELFKMLELPALRSFEFHVHSFSPRPREWSLWLPPLLSHVAGTLETLRISSETPPDEELPTVLRVVPGLRKLALSNLFVTSSETTLTQRTLDLMNPTKYEGLERDGVRQLEDEGGGDGASGVGTTGLDERGIGHCLVPNLETFEYQGKIDFTSHALVEFLVARWRGPIRCTSAFGLEGPHLQLEGSGQDRHGAREPLPPNGDAPSTRLRSVKFSTPKQIQFEGADAEVVEKLRLEGMHLEFLKCPF
ncbi:hypothetical protein BJ912DRAFT_954586 [Pholiota molesta]|nr:hypothetical protein BJ912DRAFT_954586 [Pholiota molesta]